MAIIMIMYLSKENFTCPKEQIMHKELSLALALTMLKPQEQHMTFWHLSHRRATKAWMSLCICSLARAFAPCVN